MGPILFYSALGLALTYGIGKYLRYLKRWP
jgi:hypothetical protein